MSDPIPKIDMTEGANPLLYLDEQFNRRWARFNSATGTYDAVPWELLEAIATSLNAIADRLNASSPEKAAVQSPVHTTENERA